MVDKGRIAKAVQLGLITGLATSCFVLVGGALAQPIYVDMRDGGYLLLKPDGGRVAGPDGGPWVVPGASRGCEADAAPLLIELRDAGCRRNSDCIVKRLDIDHPAVPECIAAPRTRWVAKSVLVKLGELVDQCGMATRYPREVCAVATCIERRCTLGERATQAR